MKGCMVTDTKRWTDERETNREREREREGASAEWRRRKPVQ